MIRFSVWLETQEIPPVQMNPSATMGSPVTNVSAQAVSKPLSPREQLRAALKREAKRYQSGPEAAPPEPGDLEILKKKIYNDITKYFSPPESGNEYIVFDSVHSGFFQMSDKTLQMASTNRLNQYVSRQYQIVNAFTPQGKEIPVDPNVIPNIIRSRVPNPPR